MIGKLSLRAIIFEKKMDKLKSYPIHLSLFVINVLGSLAAFTVGGLLLVGYRRADSEWEFLRELVDEGSDAAPGVKGKKDETLYLKDNNADSARDDLGQVKAVAMALLVLCFLFGCLMLKQACEMLALLLWRPLGGMDCGAGAVAPYRDWVGKDYAECLAAQHKGGLAPVAEEEEGDYSAATEDYQGESLEEKTAAGSVKEESEETEEGEEEASKWKKRTTGMAKSVKKSVKSAVGRLSGKRKTERNEESDTDTTTTSITKEQKKQIKGEEGEEMGAEVPPKEESEKGASEKK